MRTLATFRNWQRLALLVAAWLSIPGVLTAQMMVRTLPATDPHAQDPNGLPYLPENSNGRDSLSASGGAARPDAPADDTHSISPTNGMHNEDEDALIREYTAKAGPVGPRKFFSASRFDATLGVGVTYDDNILLTSSGPRKSDVITTVVGGARISLGDFAERTNTYVIASYAGTGNLFAHNTEEDSYDQKAVLDILYRQHQISFGSESSFQETHDATPDFGVRVPRDLYEENFTIKYYMSDVTTLSAAVDYQHDEAESVETTDSVDATLAADYLVTSKVTLGLGAVFGRLTSTGNLEEYSEQAQARFGYAVTHKINVSAAVGVEYRERNENAGDNVTPVFVVTGTWTPFDGTKIEIEGHRRTEASEAINGEDYIDTGFQLGIRQNFLKRFYLRMDAGYQNSAYQDVSAIAPVARSDNYFTIRGTVGYDFVKWFQVLAFYEHREDQSTLDGFSFVSNRVGAEINLNY